jgi:hypothetical protein
VRAAGRSIAGFTLAPVVQTESLSGISVSVSAMAEKHIAGLHVSGVLGNLGARHEGSRIDGISAAAAIYGSDHITGITVGGAIVHARESITGITVGGFTTISTRYTGLNVAGWEVAGGQAYGVNVASGVTPHIAWGVNAGLLAVECQDVRGLSVGGLFVKSNHIAGLAVSAYTRAGSSRGLTIGIVNQSAELHGVQLGLLNLAGNNHGWRKHLPIVNAHF